MRELPYWWGIHSEESAPALKAQENGCITKFSVLLDSEFLSITWTRAGCRPRTRIMEIFPQAFPQAHKASGCMWKTETIVGERQEGRTVSAKVRVSRISHYDSCQGSEDYRAWWGQSLDGIRTHSRGFASHTQDGGLRSSKLISYWASQTCAFQAAVSAFLPERITHLYSHSCAVNTKLSFCLPVGPEALQTPQPMKQLHRQVPWKADRACVPALTPAVIPNIYI